jgi:hypothetical protein
VRNSIPLTRAFASGRDDTRYRVEHKMRDVGELAVIIVFTPAGADADAAAAAASAANTPVAFGGPAPAGAATRMAGMHPLPAMTPTAQASVLPGYSAPAAPPPPQQPPQQQQQPQQRAPPPQMQQQQAYAPQAYAPPPPPVAQQQYTPTPMMQPMAPQAQQSGGGAGLGFAGMTPLPKAPQAYAPPPPQQQVQQPQVPMAQVPMAQPMAYGGGVAGYGALPVAQPAPAPVTNGGGYMAAAGYAAAPTGGVAGYGVLSGAAGYSVAVQVPHHSTARAGLLGIHPAAPKVLMLLLDTTGSMNFPAAEPRIAVPPPPPRRDVLRDALACFVQAVERRQGASGVGLRSLTFGGGAAYDLGYLSTHDMAQQWGRITWEGGTYLAPAWQLVANTFAAEVGTASGAALATLLLTDGEAADLPAFEAALRPEAHAFVLVALIGFGEEHDKAYKSFTGLAARNPRVKARACTCVHICPCLARWCVMADALCVLFCCWCRLCRLRAR